MQRRWFVFAGILALAGMALLCTPQTSQAQRWRGSRGVSVGVGNGGVYVGRGWDYGGYYGSPYYGQGNRYYGNTYWPNYSGYSGSWYYPQTEYYNSFTPSYYTGELPQNFAQPYYSDYYSQPMTTGGQFYGAGIEQNPNSAFVTVRVPPDAEIWFENYQTHQKGLMRDFISPPLTPGQQYTYDIRAQWTDNGKKVDQKKQVTVMAGSRTNVDFLPSQGQAPTNAQQRFGTPMYGAPELNQPNQPNPQLQNNPNATPLNQSQGSSNAPLPGTTTPSNPAPAPSGTTPAPGGIPPTPPTTGGPGR